MYKMSTVLGLPSCLIFLLVVVFSVLQYKGNGDVFIYDLGSTHGTVVNKIQVVIFIKHCALFLLLKHIYYIVANIFRFKKINALQEDLT
jgi:hypothetical protein